MFPRATLIEAVWGYDCDIESNTLDAFIRLLRAKLEGKDGPRLIQTVRGVGYAIRDTLARADAGKETLDRTPVDLASLVLEVSGQAEKLAQQKGITLACKTPEGSAPVSGDRGTLRRLFFILLDNAVKYTPPGGRISQQDLPHIFERFYRADKSRNRDSGGAGLGLSLAKWIVEAHGGFMEVESAVDNGSTFRVSLPKVPA